MKLSERYVRQIRFDGIGEKGQQAIARSTALIIGSGGLGSHAAEMLARAGIGTLELVDRDIVDWSNLQRQSLFTEQDTAQGLPKVVAAKNHLEQINHNITVHAHIDDIHRYNIEQYIKRADVVIDGTDQFQTRFLINETCVKHRIPWVYGSCSGAGGMSMTILPGRTPCLACVFEQLPNAASTASSENMGILEAAVSTVASIQISEVLKILTQQINSINQQLYAFDLWENTFDSIAIEHKSSCKVCGYRQFPFLAGKFGTYFTTVRGANSVLIRAQKSETCDLQLLYEKWKQQGTPVQTDYYLRMDYKNCTITLFPDKAAIVDGTNNTGTARGVYHELINK